jgi:23S rRNA pseudouridine1911/1915/1917 synthase
MPQFSVAPNDRISLSIRHEDEHLLVVEKPARMVSTPGLGHETDSLLNGLFARFGNRLQNLGRERDFGLLHRLDRGASGLLIVALRASTYDALRRQFEEREVRKFYFAIVSGAPRAGAGVIRRPIVEERSSASRGRKEMKLARLAPSGKPAVTAYRVLSSAPAASLLECRAVTGRLHQLRVHLESIGCAILGDDVYAAPAIAKAAPRLALHAHRVVFDHPDSKERLDVRAPLPRDLRKVCSKLGLTVDRTDPGVASNCGEN